MTTLIVSLAAALGSEVYAGRGNPVAVLCDIVCNKDTGKITYFILCPRTADTEEDGPEEYFAIHHSYFYFEEESESLTYSAKLGNNEHSFFLDLPDQYDEVDVRDLNDFNRFLSGHSGVAGHRSDND